MQRDVRGGIAEIWRSRKAIGGNTGTVVVLRDSKVDDIGGVRGEFLQIDQECKRSVGKEDAFML